MQAAMQMAGELVDRLKAREKILQEQFEARIVSEIDVLETSAALTEMKLKMSGFEEEHKKYKLQLTSLIGLTGLVDFRVAAFDFQTPIEQIDIDLPLLEQTALGQRPELIEQVIEERITAEDARIAVTKMAPTTTVFWKYNYDGDSHLYYDKWHEVGLRVSLNLLSIPQQRSQKREVLRKKELVRKRRLSLAAAIMTQLNIAVVNYKDVARKHSQTKEIEAKRRQLMEARRRHAQLGKGRIEDVLKSEARHLFSQVSTLSSYADVMIAEARIFNTIGQNKR
jgi:outer membrane protein TolC